MDVLIDLFFVGCWILTYYLSRFKDAMSQMVETGTIGGNNGMLTPTSATTRAEMAQVLYNLFTK